MIKIFIIVIPIVFLYLFVKKPYILSAILLFMLLYGFNLKLPFLFDLRGLLLIGMIGRLLFEKENQNLIAKYLLTNKYFYMLIGFIFYSLAILLLRFYGIDDFSLIKDNLILIGSLILGFIVGVNPKGKNVFIIAIISSGIFASIDLLYTYIVLGNNNPVRVINVFLYNDNTQTNYNYHGMLIGIALIYTLLLYYKKIFPKIISLTLIFLFVLGVVLTTSRGAILAVIIVFIVMVLTQKEIKISFKKIITSSILLIFFFISFYLIYNTILSEVSKPVLIDNIYWRLYEEPLSVFGITPSGNHKYTKDVQYGTMSWRYDRSEVALEKFMTSNMVDQLFGIGEGGYVIQNYSGDNLNAHNGYVLLLVERGIIGVLIFFTAIILLIIDSLKLYRYTTLNIPIIYLLLFLLMYIMAQNDELTTSLAFLIFGGIIGNNINTKNKSSLLSGILKYSFINDRKSKELKQQPIEFSNNN